MKGTQVRRRRDIYPISKLELKGKKDRQSSSPSPRQKLRDSMCLISPRLGPSILLALGFVPLSRVAFPSICLGGSLVES